MKLEKSIINCKVVDVNQLIPMKYMWAWEHYLNGCSNHWMPTEVQMHEDIKMWKTLSDKEKLMIKRNLGFFSTAESLVGNNIVLAIYKHITNPEARQYLLRQAFEEAIHSHTFLYIIESLSLDHVEIYETYNRIVSVKAKDAMQIKLTENIINNEVNTSTTEGIQKLVENLVGFYVIMEGIFFYSGFAMILSMRNQNKMVGLGELFNFILRDETIHLNFGIDLINTIIKENVEIWTKEFKNNIISMIKEAVILEINYAQDCLPEDGVLGLNSKMFISYVKYIADRRLERIGLPIQYNERDPFPGLLEPMDVSKQENFFERTVQSYQSRSVLNWNDS